MSDWPIKQEEIPEGMEECYFCESDGLWVNGLKCPECRGAGWIPKATPTPEE